MFLSCPRHLHTNSPPISPVCARIGHALSGKCTARIRSTPAERNLRSVYLGDLECYCLRRPTFLPSAQTPGCLSNLPLLAKTGGNGTIVMATGMTLRLFVWGLVYIPEAGMSTATRMGEVIIYVWRQNGLPRAR